ncbi:hypothetical protein FSP39_003442 [Pinctada imbricata]|uniref:Envelope fusion protein n=1 Tax=Pinctada imbricata TaxID=66713 RepID=A0AA88XEY5_PINIB|nr:hypothetical protein FSP39_003442 [Pinctada imbricata]
MMSIFMILLSFGSANETPEQRLNYGILFEPAGKLYLGQEYWIHTFEIPLPKKISLQRPLTCHANYCKYAQHVLKMLNALHMQMMSQVNSTVHQIHSLLPQTHLPKPDKFIGSSRSKRGLFDFIGKISKSLFGTATSDEVATIRRHMQLLNRNNAKIAKAMAIQEQHLSSVISNVNDRFDNVMNAVQENHQDTVALTSLLQTSIDAMEHEFAILESLILKQTNASAQLQNALEHVKLSVHELLKGKLSPFLITPQNIRSSLHQVQSIIDNKFPKFHIIHKDPLYYFSYGEFLYSRVHSNLYLSLKIPISPFQLPLSVYSVYSFPVPVNASSSHATKLMDTPTYFAHTSDNQHFTTLTSSQLSKCNGQDSDTKFCSFHLSLTSSASPTCISAIFYKNKALVHNLCDFRFIIDEIKPAIIELSTLNTLMYRTDMIALDCPSGQRIIKGCSFCVMQIPCLCSLTSGNLFLPPKVGSCTNNSDTVTVLHPVNLALIQEFFDPRFHKAIFGDTSFRELRDINFPSFNIFNHSFLQYLANDKQHHLSMKKMAKIAKRDETVFKSLAESMLAGQIDFSTSSFPDTDGLIALVGTSLAFLCIIYCIWSYFKIRKLTTLLALTHVTNPSHAFPTLHPDLSLMYTKAPEVDEKVTIFENIYTSFTTPWPYVTLSVFTTLFICFYAHKLWKKFKSTHKTTLHIELTTGTECILLQLATLPLCPDNWVIQPPQDIHNINIHRTCLLWATVTLETSEFAIQNVHTNKQLNIPTSFNISVIKAYRLRRLLRQPYTAYFLLSHHRYFRLLQ